MSATETLSAPPAIQTLNIVKDRLIAAPIDIVFESVLTPAGPMADMSLKLERWPGGRWFRDLGNNTGHLWGHVQVIKPPKLLEIIGPMFMSYAVASFLQYRLTEESAGTRLTVTHQAIGLISAQHREGVNKGWDGILDSIKAASESKGVKH
ncbi:MAG: SRPBCC domain-containing protein [Tepidisphaeraceae bacterium]|jgi:uncharacterized protein YndB with AHSA1/START domain